VVALPAITLVAFVALLVAAGAPAHAPSAAVAARNLGRLGIVDLAVLVFGATALGLLLSPFQVGLVRMLEGYWAPSGPIGVFAEHRRERYRELRHELKDLAIVSHPLTRWEQRHPHLIEQRQRAADRRLTALPSDDARVLPTRLGNMLRRHEDLAGQRYGLDALEVIPRLYPIAPAAMIDLIEDARNEMDVMVTFVLTWLLATASAVYLLRDHGAWLLLALGTYGLAWASYRAAVVAAGVYGRTLMRAVDLYRFDLIEKLRLAPAERIADEIAHNRAIAEMLLDPRGPGAVLPAEIPRLHRYQPKPGDPS
jgi:hypothetical protein